MAIFEVVSTLLKLLQLCYFHLISQGVGRTLSPLLPQVLHSACVVISSHAPGMHLSLLQGGFSSESEGVTRLLFGNLLLDPGLIPHLQVTFILPFLFILLLFVAESQLELSHELVFLSSLHVKLELIEARLGHQLRCDILLCLLLKALHHISGHFELGEARQAGVLRDSLLQREVLFGILDAALLMEPQLPARERAAIGARLEVGLEVLHQKHRVLGPCADVVDLCIVVVLDVRLP